MHPGLPGKAAHLCVSAVSSVAAMLLTCVGAIRSGSRLVPLWSTPDEPSQLFWSAATCQTCRRYGPGVRRKAATSRRTPYRTRYLSVFCAHPAAETDSHL